MQLELSSLFHFLRHHLIYKGYFDTEEDALRYADELNNGLMNRGEQA